MVSAVILFTVLSLSVLKICPTHLVDEITWILKIKYSSSVVCTVGWRHNETMKVFLYFDGQYVETRSLSQTFETQTHWTAGMRKFNNYCVYCFLTQCCVA